MYGHDNIIPSPKVGGLLTTLNYPIGFYNGIVLCIIPPFVKRVRIYKNRWTGFDKNWRFVFIKELKE